MDDKAQSAQAAGTPQESVVFSGSGNDNNADQTSNSTFALQVSPVNTDAVAAVGNYNSVVDATSSSVTATSNDSSSNANVHADTNNNNSTALNSITQFPSTPINLYSNIMNLGGTATAPDINNNSDHSAVINTANVVSKNSSNNVSTEVIKRKRGRPRKNPLPTTNKNESIHINNNNGGIVSASSNSDISDSGNGNGSATPPRRNARRVKPQPGEKAQKMVVDDTESSSAEMQEDSAQTSARKPKSESKGSPKSPKGSNSGPGTPKKLRGRKRKKSSDDEDDGESGNNSSDNRASGSNGARATSRAQRDHREEEPSLENPPKIVRKEGLGFGDLVWAKVKSCPWWPAKIIDLATTPLKIPKKVHDLKQDNALLVRFYFSEDFGWIAPENLIPFKENLKEFYKLTREDNVTDAVEDAIEDSGNSEELYAELHEDDIPCEICGSRGDSDRMLLCDNCDEGWHIFCLNPPLARIPDTNWYCDKCKRTDAQKDINVDSVPITNIKPGVIGLANLGASCYINSVIQCLNGARDFRKTFSKKQLSGNSSFLASLQAIIQALWSEKGVHHKSLRELKERSGDALDFKYHSAEHQDINEYLIQLLDYTHQQLIKEHQYQQQPQPPHQQLIKEHQYQQQPQPPHQQQEQQLHQLQLQQQQQQQQQPEQQQPQQQQQPTNVSSVASSPSSMDATADNIVGQPLPTAPLATHTTPQPSSATPNRNNSNINNSNINSNNTAGNMSDDAGSVISECFDGRLCRTRKCPVGHVVKSFEAFRILPLQFPYQEHNGDKRSKSRANSSSNNDKNKKPSGKKTEDNSIKLEDMLQQVSLQETLECRCVECGGTDNKKFVQQSFIDSFPKYLIIQLGSTPFPSQNDVPTDLQTVFKTKASPYDRDFHWTACQMVAEKLKSLCASS